MEFTFPTNVVEDLNAFYAGADSPFRSVADVAARARAAPGTMTCGSTGIGSDDHLGEMGGWPLPAGAAILA
jgi:tripartite-type tricarboxylate transporter receptor subunit TctC